MGLSSPTEKTKWFEMGWADPEKSLSLSASTYFWHNIGWAISQDAFHKSGYISKAQQYSTPISYSCAQQAGNYEYYSKLEVKGEKLPKCLLTSFCLVRNRIPYTVYHCIMTSNPLTRAAHDSHSFLTLGPTLLQGFHCLQAAAFPINFVSYLHV